MKKSTALMTLAALILTAPFVIALWGWSASVMWRWFVVPVFDVPVLSVAQSIGLCSAISLFTGTSSQSVRQGITSNDKGDKGSAFVSLAIFSTVPLFIVLSGWIVKGFV